MDINFKNNYWISVINSEFPNFITNITLEIQKHRQYVQYVSFIFMAIFLITPYKRIKKWSNLHQMCQFKLGSKNILNLQLSLVLYFGSGLPNRASFSNENSLNLCFSKWQLLVTCEYWTPGIWLVQLKSWIFCFI